MTYKEEHSKNHRKIIEIKKVTGISLAKKIASVHRIITQCMSCTNQFITFFYDGDDIDMYITGDKLKGGQRLTHRIEVNYG